MKVRLTVDELVATIGHSSVPTVLVEGEDDAKIYRWFQQKLGIQQADFLYCGGRGPLLQIFDRRSEFADKQVCFLADSDMWIFSGIPMKYREVVFTEGYSIENDIYVDSGVEEMLSEDETANHKIMISELCRWFAWQVRKYLDGQLFCSKPELYKLIPDGTHVCCQNQLAAEGFIEPTHDEYESIFSHYMLKLRGKLLYKALSRFLSKSGRRPTHSLEQIIDISIKRPDSRARVTRILDAIRSKLNVLGPSQLDLPMA